MVDQFDGAPYRMNCYMEDKISADTDSIAIHYKVETHFCWQNLGGLWHGHDLEELHVCSFYNRMSKIPLWETWINKYVCHVFLFFQ